MLNQFNNRYISDLNVIVSFSTNLFSLIYDTCDCDKTKYKDWNALFDALRNRDEKEKVKSSIHTSLEKIGYTYDDLEHIQNLRRIRNRLSHPRVPLSVAKIMAFSRWKGDPAYGAITKMYEILSSHCRKSSS